MTEASFDQDLPELEAVAKYLMNIRGLKWEISGVAMKETYFTHSAKIINFLETKKPAVAVSEALSSLESKPPTELDQAKALEDDLNNVIEAEGIDPRLFMDHPELKQIVIQKFEFDYAGYNEALLECLKQWAGTLNIDLNKYGGDAGEDMEEVTNDG